MATKPVPGASLPFQKSLRLGKAKMAEFGKLIEGFTVGYRNREDVTALAPGILVQGSQNVLTNTFRRVGACPGYVLDGQRDTSGNPILSGFDWQTSYGPELHLRAGFNVLGSDGKLQFRYVANAGDVYKTNTFTAGQVYYIDLMTGLGNGIDDTGVRFNFTDFFDETELESLLLFVNQTPNIFMWSGAVATMASATTNTFYIPAYLTGNSNAQSNPANWATVTNGSFRIALDGNPAVNVTGISFTGVTTMAQVVNKIQLALRAVTGGLETVSFNTDYFVITSGNTTSSSAISVLTTSTASVGTDISGVVPFWLSMNSGNGTANPAVVSNAITINGSKTWEQLGFLNTGTYSQSVSINGNVYTYNGGADTLTLTGVSPSPASEPANSVVFQSVVTTPNSSIPGLPETFKNYLIRNLDGQIFISSSDNYNLYTSKSDTFRDFTFSTPRLPGEGAVSLAAGVPQALIKQQDTLYVSAGQNSWEQVLYTPGNETVSGVTILTETISLAPLNTANLQGTLSQAATTTIKNLICFVSNEPIVNSFGVTTNYLNAPQMTDMSYSIVNDINAYDLTDCSVSYFQKFAYVCVPKQGLMRVYNMTDEGTTAAATGAVSVNYYWEAPILYAMKQTAVIDGELYGHSYQSSNTFKLFTGYSFDKNVYEAIAAFSFENTGERHLRKMSDSCFTEGYISSNATLTLTLQRELTGGSTATFPILGSDTRIVEQPIDQASLGKTSLGKHPLGGDENIISGKTSKFRVYKTYNSIGYFEEQKRYSSLGVNQIWEIVSFGSNARVDSNQPSDITQ